LPRLAEGEFALVGKHLEHAIRTPTDPVRWGSGMTDLDFRILCAEASAQARDAAGLAEHVSPAEEAARVLGHRLYCGVAQRARGVALQLVGQPRAAVDSHTQAAEIFLTLGTRWQLGRTLAARAEAFVSAGDLAAAQADLSQAAALFETQGAAPAARQAREALAALGDGGGD
jgi:hypothetical protein